MIRRRSFSPSQAASRQGTSDRRFAEAPSSLVRPFLIVTLDPAIKIDLEIGDRAVDLLAKGDAIELIEHRLVEPLDDAIRLRALGLGARMVDILERQVELVFVMLRVCRNIPCRDRSARGRASPPSHHRTAGTRRSLYRICLSFSRLKKVSRKRSRSFLSFWSIFQFAFWLGSSVSLNGRGSISTGEVAHVRRVGHCLGATSIQESPHNRDQGGGRGRVLRS